ncbi:MAG: VCBS repeat-containing protein [Flavobacteriales bacterium]
MKQQLTTLLFLLPVIAFSQGFTNGNSTYGISMVNTGAISHGAGVTFYDFNQDGYDDITFCSASDSLVFYESTGTGFIRKEIIPNNLDMRQASWCDFDKDGDPDLLVTKARNTGNNTKFYRNDGYPVFTEITDDLNLPNMTGVRSYGHTWGDYDKDGWIDLYICNYNITGGITNWLFHNNGDGTFTEVSMLAGVSNGSNLTFQATFCDFNEDSWPDLFLINDLNQTSTMYMNNGDGTFTDVGADNGAHLMIEAMCISIDDFQNDDDWDIRY